MPDQDIRSEPEIIPELDGIRARIIASMDAARTVAEGLSDAQFNRRPGADEWSVCECLGHLVLVGEKLCVAFDTAIEKAHRDGKLGRGPFRYGPLESWFARAASQTQPSARKRFRTFKLYEPRHEQSAVNVLSAYNTLQRNLVERVEAASGLDLARIKITSPATRWVRLSLGQWLVMVAGHQERHLAQATRARARIQAG